MALSILWVIVFHFNTPPVVTILDSFRSIGCGGVDIFFFLSGFGLCNSYYHRSGITSMNFYKRRFLRILPTYFLCIIVFGLTKSVPVTDLLWQMSCIGYWIHKPYYDWYVQSILLLYLVFPIFIKLARRYGIGKIVLFASILGLLPTLFLYLHKQRHMDSIYIKSSFIFYRGIRWIYACRKQMYPKTYDDDRNQPYSLFCGIISCKIIRL